MNLAIKEIKEKLRKEQIFLALVLLLFMVLVLRLFQLQIVSHTEYLVRAIGNKVQVVRISAPRGEIFDRSGAPLAINRPSTALKYFLHNPTKSKTAIDAGQSSIGELDQEVIKSISSKLKLNFAETIKDIERQRKMLYPYQPVTILEGLTLNQLAYLEENKEKFPGIIIEANSYLRTYPLGEAGTHLIGYVGKPSPEELKNLANPSIFADDLVGKDGIERVFNDVTKGAYGERLVEVDKNRHFRGELKLNPPIKGKDIYLTIDAEIQKKAYSILRGTPGAIIVMRPKTGEVLALVSSPSYDPNKFRERGGYEYLTKVLSRKDYPPMLNRAISNSYPPGSTVKPIIVLQALQEGKVTEGTTFYCQGKLDIGNRTFFCWQRQGHGTLNLIDVLGKSCDTAVFQIGLKLGVNNLERVYREFGFGQETRIALPGEAEGLIPNPVWKRKHYSQANYKEVDRIWYDGDTANMSIGQGFILATPLQVLLMINALANDGEYVTPIVVKGLREGEQVIPFEAPRRIKLNFDTEYIQLVKRGLRRTNLPGGTAEMIGASLKVAGKTGTAEIWKGEPHSWFVGYMPFDDPQVSFVVFLENGGSSLTSAVPKAKELSTFLKNYLSLNT